MERISVLRSGVQSLHAGLDNTENPESITENRVDRTRMEEKSTHSSGMVVYTVTNPAIPPIPNVIALGSGWPGRAVPCTNCLSVTYVVNRTAEFAP